METDLSSRAMLISISISTWTARKYDKKATQGVADTYNTDEKAGRYNKSLLPAENDAYKAIGQIGQAARADLYQETLPWLDSGARILTSMNYLNCMSIMRKRQREFQEAVPEFVRRYPFMKNAAKNMLNGLYQEADYPAVSEVAERFSFEIRVFPLPSEKDFRVALHDDDLAEIRQSIVQDTTGAIGRAMEEPYRRLADGVAHMGARLRGDKTCPCRNCRGKSYTTDTFSDTLITNLQEMCEQLPRLNLTGDPDLTELIEEVKTGLTGFLPEAVRGNDAVRQTLIERAAEIQRNMAGYYGANA